MQPIVFQNGTPWLDTDGNIIHCHGGHIVQFGDTYYWYGENRQGAAYVSCYASKDLNRWEFRNNILTTLSPTEDIGLEGDSVLTRNGKKINIERPKVVHNARTGKYVMWAHYENGKDYSAAAIALASCDTPDGDFVYHGFFRPFGCMSRDCNVFAFEGDMYFLSASNENEDLHVYRMTDDYMGVAEQVNKLFIGESREAPALFYHGDTIYMFTSMCTGWCPNQGGYSFADSLLHQWEAIRDCGDDTTYHSQPTAVLTLCANGNTQYVYIGDRWGGSAWDGQNVENFIYENSTYYFTLIEIDQDGKLQLQPCEQFTIDLENDGFKIVK